MAIFEAKVSGNIVTVPAHSLLIRYKNLLPVMNYRTRRYTHFVGRALYINKATGERLLPLVNKNFSE